MEGGVVCIKEWMREEISLKRGGRWEKRNILEGREIREKARNTSGRERKKTKGEDKNVPGRMGERKK